MNFFLLHIVSNEAFQARSNFLKSSRRYQGYTTKCTNVPRRKLSSVSKTFTGENNLLAIFIKAWMAFQPDLAHS